MNFDGGRHDGFPSGPAPGSETALSWGFFSRILFPFRERVVRHHAIIRDMLRIILREIFIFAGSLFIFPAAVVLLMVQSESLDVALRVLSRGLFLGELVGLTRSIFAVGVKLVTPYIVIQAVRAHLWSRRSLSGRRWANIYFFALLTGIGVWSLWNAADLFYFMYALGDMPAELAEFVRIEGVDLLVSLASFLLAVRCFKIFLNPRPRIGPSAQNAAE